MSNVMRGQVERATEVFEALDEYGKGQIAAWGTAFTTYEDEGEDFCLRLNELADAWRREAKPHRA